MTLAQRLAAYMQHKGYTLDTAPNEVNIIYLEGANEDGTPNADRPDEWNDRRIVLTFADGEPKIALNAAATSEPGTSATFSDAAADLGGVARIQIGQFAAWRVFYHKYAQFGPAHPALVQSRPLKVHRDANRNQKRTGDALDWVHGLNQHGTNPTARAERVSGYLAGCLVGQSWPLHLQFMDIVKADPRYIADNEHVFTTTVIDATDFAKFKPKADKS